MRLVHSFEKNGTLRCSAGKCEKIYSTSDSYRKHVEREHQFELDSPEPIQQLSTCNANVFASDSGDFAIANSEPMNIVTNETDIGYVLQLFSRNVLMFALKTREQYKLPKSTCHAIMQDMSSLFNTFFSNFV